MRSVRSRLRLRSQAAMVRLRLAFDGSTLLTMNISSRRPADRLGDDLLGAAVAVHFRGVDQRDAELDAEPERRDLVLAAARASPMRQVPSPNTGMVSPDGSLVVGMARPAMDSDRLVVFAHLGMRAQHGVHRLEHLAHARFRHRALDHHHQLGLVRGGAHQPPGAVLAP